jgi:hypothetical protein
MHGSLSPARIPLARIVQGDKRRRKRDAQDRAVRWRNVGEMQSDRDRSNRKYLNLLALPREAHEFKQRQQLSSEFGMRAWH